MKTLLILWFASNGADLLTTQVALNHPEIHEANKVMANGHARVPLKIGSAVALAVVAERLHDRHPKLAKGLLSVGTAANLTVAGFNISTTIRVGGK